MKKQVPDILIFYIKLWAFLYYSPNITWRPPLRSIRVQRHFWEPLWRHRTAPGRISGICWMVKIQRNVIILLSPLYILVYNIELSRDLTDMFEIDPNRPLLDWCCVALSWNTFEVWYTNLCVGWEAWLGNRTFRLVWPTGNLQPPCCLTARRARPVLLSYDLRAATMTTDKPPTPSE